MSDLIERIRGLKAGIVEEKKRHALSMRLLYVKHPYTRKTVPRYSPEETNARVDDYNAQYRQNTRRYYEEAQMLQREAWERVERAMHFPLDRALTSTQRGEVAERLPIMRAEMAGLSDDQIKQRLLSAASDPNATTSERAAMFLAAGERRRAIEDRRREQLQHQGAQPEPSYESLTALDEPLAELEELLVGEYRGKHVNAARAVYNEAYEVAEQLYLARTTGGKGKAAGDAYFYEEAEKRRRERERRQAEEAAQAEAFNSMDAAQKRQAARDAAG